MAHRVDLTSDQFFLFPVDKLGLARCERTVIEKQGLGYQFRHNNNNNNNNNNNSNKKKYKKIKKIKKIIIIIIIIILIRVFISIFPKQFKATQS